MAWRRPRGFEVQINALLREVFRAHGGKVAHFFAAIAYGEGIVLCEQYHGKLNGQSFAKFVREHFPRLFATCSKPRGKLFLQDTDPSKNSRRARDAIHAIGTRKFSILPRSPDINPIESYSHEVKPKLNYSDALEKSIEHENFEKELNKVWKISPKT